MPPVDSGTATILLDVSRVTNVTTLTEANLETKSLIPVTFVKN